MRTFANVFGRILLAASAALLLAWGIPSIISCAVGLTEANGWWQFAVASNLRLFLILCFEALACIGGVIAIMAAVVGKRSFWLAFFAILMLILPTYTVITGIIDGTLSWEWLVLWPLLRQFSAPVLYFVGFMLLLKNE